MTSTHETGTTPDQDVTEDFADEVGVGPTHEEIDTHRRLEKAAEPPPAIDGPAG